ncbi:MAG: sensor histidine kinase [Longimicrobiales bacterium]
MQSRSTVDEPLIRNPWKRWAVVLGVWTLLALFFVLQAITARIAFGEPLDLRKVAGNELSYWYVWAVLSPLVLYLARRYRIGSAVESAPMGGLAGTARSLSRSGSILLHSIFAVILSAAHAVLTFVATTELIAPMRGPSGPVTFSQFIRKPFPVELFTGFYKYWLIVLIYWALDYSRKYRQREVQTAQLQTQLAQAQLQALKMQLHPHFLFNTLHSVSMLNFTDVDAANRMLVQLSDLLRLTLENSGAQEVRLRQELDFLRRYLEIEQTRFHDRLSVQIDADPKLLDAYLPNLILQPIVENAIRHGVGKLARPGRVRVRALRHGNELVLEVYDDGAGLPEGWQLEQDAGLGLSNTLARLQQMYGERQRFELVAQESGGVVVRITIPLSFGARGTEAA